jgi:hypothetical protein
VGFATDDASPPADAAPHPADAAHADSAGDAGTYRDPAPGDGACTTPNLVCPDPDGGAGACVAVSEDENNCGACGNVCSGASAACLAGQCSCSNPGFAYCTGAGCMDVSSDTNNCGACGNVCDPNQFTACQGGMCVP